MCILYCTVLRVVYYVFRVVYRVWFIWLCVRCDVYYVLRIVSLCIMRCVMHMMDCVYCIVLYHGVLCSVQCVLRIWLCIACCIMYYVLPIVFGTVRIVRCVL